MKTAGIIVEYNPFHNGHQYHMEQTRALTGADFVIAVMSGDFVQRGEPAILDKYTRTQMALLGGADLVLELPACFATGSAGDFAAGSISLLDKLGVVDFLCFGSECGSIGPLTRAAALLADEPPAFSAALQAGLKAGLSFPRARAEALKSCLTDTMTDDDCSASAAGRSAISPDMANLISSPNNILGLEYCLALQKRHSSILPVTIRREGADYHEKELSSNHSLPSASAIRAALQKDSQNAAGTASAVSSMLRDSIAPAVPAAAASLWQDIFRNGQLLFSDDLSKELRYRLLSEAASGFTQYADVTRELSDKLVKNVLTASNWTGLCETLKSKELTYSRISRCLCHILLSITAKELACARQNDFVPYARILGFRKSAAPLFSEIKKSSEIPLLSKLADAHRFLSPDALFMLEKDILASHIRESTLAAKTGTLPRNEYTRQIVIL